MSNSNYSQNIVWTGLGTYTTKVMDAGIYKVSGHIDLPTLSKGVGQSSCLTVINVNGSPVYTGVAGAEGFLTDVTCAALDVITIVLSSSAAADLPLNVIKASFSISVGP